MDIPLNAKVYTKEGHIGRSMCIIVNPISQNVTHFVLRRKDEFRYQELVPVQLIQETTPDMILLSCHTHDLVGMDSFTKSEYMDFDGAGEGFASDGLDDVMAWPYRPYSDIHNMSVVVEQTPRGELGIHRGAEVEATDGKVGRFEKLPRNKPRTTAHF